MGNCVSLCVSFRQGAGLERVWAAREEWCHPSLDLRPRNTCVADCMPARSFRAGRAQSGKPSDDFEADRLKSRHPLQCVRHVPERDLARDEPRRVPLSARDERQKLVVVGVRIALRAHHLPLPRDEVVDRDGDLTALLLRGQPHLDMPSVLGSEWMDWLTVKPRPSASIEAWTPPSSP